MFFPSVAYALTGGPSQPEFNSFTPIGASDMVDLSSGDLNYNIPLLDVGGYPLNLAYSSTVGMDQEASMVGLGWNLSVGQINRSVRGIPDDFNGDKMTYENYLKPNVTVGADFKFRPAILGNEETENQDATGDNSSSSSNSGSQGNQGNQGGQNQQNSQEQESNPSNLTEDELGNATFGVSALYNNYTGFTMKPSFGIQLDMGKYSSIDFNVQSGPNGLAVSPSLSIHKETKIKKNRNNKLGLGVGTSWSSRRGLSYLTMDASLKNQNKKSTSKEGKYKTTVNYSKSLGSHIDFADQIYTPTKRVGMTTGSFTVNAALDAEIFGVEGGGQITAYGTVSKVKESEKKKIVKAYGYLNTDEAKGNSIKDFNREKDGAFSVNTTNLPLTNYTYDSYTIQGQGVSGSYRPYRNQVGFVNDAFVQDGSTSGTFGFEIGTGNLFHGGLDIETSGTNSSSGLWSVDNHMLENLVEDYTYDPDVERVYYKNTGDLSGDRDPLLFQNVGEYNPVRVEFSGAKFYRSTEKKLMERVGANGNESPISVDDKLKRTKRQFRNQAIQNFTFGELNKGMGYGPLVNSNTHQPEYTPSSNMPDHHHAEVNVIRNDGARYVYGLPVVNLQKKEATFAVDLEESEFNCEKGLVGYNSEDLDSPKNLPNDKYLNRITTPAYVHSYLLTSILSTDYQDVTGDGPSKDDLGTYTKFSYSKKNSAYNWRVPFEKGMASYNPGLRANYNDDQGNYVFGKKELYYIDKIETKTHIAVFKYSPRRDANGVKDEKGGMGHEQYMYKLDEIALYALPEYNPLQPDESTPIKRVHFEYSYSLCTGVPNYNYNLDSGKEISSKGGKLTLKKVYFTYRNSLMGKYTNYKFNYNEYKPLEIDGVTIEHPDEYTPGVDVNDLVINSDMQVNGTGENPNYNITNYDTWGNYMPNTGSCSNTNGPVPSEFPFTSQNQTEQDRRSAVWLLKHISLPSGGVTDVFYESDDYAWVQDKPTMQMYKVAGAGGFHEPTISDYNLLDGSKTATLYGPQILNKPHKYLYVKIEDPSKADVNSLLKGLRDEPIHFRFLMNMTKAGSNLPVPTGPRYEFVSGYFYYDNELNDPIIFDQEFNGSTEYFLSIPVKYVDQESLVNNEVHPISKAAWNHGRKYLNDLVYSAMPNGDSEGIEQIVEELLTPQVLVNLFQTFLGPNGTLKKKGVGRRFVKDYSYVRLNVSGQIKLGGGSRVNQIRTSDVWASMNPDGSDYQTVYYGQNYKYDLEDGMSSGVATYEPVGNKENPFVQPVFSTIEHILAPNEENYVEMPFGQSFFPSPQVTYSRVSVSSIEGGEKPTEEHELKKLHKTGEVVTEFYTSKDYPTIVSQTKMKAVEDKRDVLDNILKLNVRKYLTASQGFVIHVNDMNGKQKSQRVYAEDQEVAISGVDYLYENNLSPDGFNAAQEPDVAKGKLNNVVPVIGADGKVSEQMIGVETDVVNDFRESKSVTSTFGMNTNLATITIGGLALTIPTNLADMSLTEHKFRSVSTTKVIQTYGILKETIAYDAGASVSTKNLAWDANTGEVLLTETVDEYHDKYYTLNYPAHWFYDGMGQAAQNLGLIGALSPSGGSFQIAGISQVSNYLIPGDELFLKNQEKTVWVSNVNSSGNLFQLIDENGVSVTGVPANEPFEIVRSGHRNLQSAGIMNVTLMTNPLFDSGGSLVADLSDNFLASTNWEDWKIIDAGAVDYSDDWKVDCECGNNSGEEEVNPYRINEKGVWRTKSSRTYLTGRNFHAEVTPRREGFYTAFSPMYKVDPLGNWTKDYNDWTYVAEVTKYSPYGFELENKDALHRHSSAQYGYNHTFPVMVGANAQYREIGFDGFEDRSFDQCPYSSHFSFSEGGQITPTQSHTGRYSIQVIKGSRATISKKLGCEKNTDEVEREEASNEEEEEEQEEREEREEEEERNAREENEVESENAEER